jgi:hypothetical protein
MLVKSAFVWIHEITLQLNLFLKFIECDFVVVLWVKQAND